MIVCFILQFFGPNFAQIEVNPEGRLLYTSYIMFIRKTRAEFLLEIDSEIRVSLESRNESPDNALYESNCSILDSQLLWMNRDDRNPALHLSLMGVRY